MFLKKTPNKSGRINLAIVDGYYDKATKKTKHKVIESLGYLDELELDKFLNNRQRHTKESYDANTILKMLVYSRILAPASKKSSFDHHEMFFEKTNYSIDDVYRCLSFLNKHKETIQVWMNDKIKENCQVHKEG